MKKILNFLILLAPLTLLCSCSGDKTKINGNNLNTELNEALIESEINSTLLPTGELELNVTEIVIEQGEAFGIKVLTEPYNEDTEGLDYNKYVSFTSDSDIIALHPKSGAITAQTDEDDLGTAIVTVEVTPEDGPPLKDYVKVTVVPPNRLHLGDKIVQTLIEKRGWSSLESEMPIAYFNNDILKVTGYSGNLDWPNDKLDLEIIIPDYTDLEINGETELQWIIEQVFSNSSDVSQILENIKPRNNIEQEFENRLVDIGWQGNDAVRVRIYGKKLPLN